MSNTIQVLRRSRQTLCKQELKEGLETHLGEERSDEDHEDVVEDQHRHEHGHHPRAQEEDAGQEVRDKGKSKNILEYPSIAGMPLQSPPGNNAGTEDESQDEARVRPVLQDGDPVLREPERGREGGRERGREGGGREEGRKGGREEKGKGGRRVDML